MSDLTDALEGYDEFRTLIHLEWGFVRHLAAAARRVAEAEAEDNTWDWCGYHKTHPMVSFDPAGDPYCWVGYWVGEVDECSSVPPIRKLVVDVLADSTG